jgi:hypothetical protein
MPKSVLAWGLDPALLNIVHARAPHAKICFNTTPTDTAEAVQRSVRI